MFGCEHYHEELPAHFSSSITSFLIRCRFVIVPNTLSRSVVVYRRRHDNSLEETQVGLGDFKLQRKKHDKVREHTQKHFDYVISFHRTNKLINCKLMCLRMPVVLLSLLVSLPRGSKP